MKYILEGVDGVGKTRFANKIVRDNPNMNYKIIHMTRETDNSLANFIKLLYSDDNIIFDRFHLGQMVYQNEDERISKGWLTNSEYITLDTVIRNLQDENKIECLYIDSPSEVVLHNCKKDRDDNHYTLEYIDELKSKYRILTNKSKVVWNLVNNDYTPNDIDISTIIQGIPYDRGPDNHDNAQKFNYESLPNIIAVDFDGCLSTDCFPDIDSAIPNKELFSYLIAFKKSGGKVILWSCRTGKSLDDAVKFCYINGLKFDAVNDNIQEVKDLLDGGPRKIYANSYIDDKNVKCKFKVKEFNI